MRRVSRQVWPRLLAVGALIGVWWGLSATGWFDASDLPSPATVWTAFVDRISDGSIPRAVERSLIRLAVGLGIAVVVGTALGILMSASTVFQRSVGSLVVALQAIPPLAWFPLAIVWMGFSERAVVFVVIVGAFPAIAMATAASIRQVPPLLVRAGRTLGAAGSTLYRHVVVPAAVPGYVEGLRQGWVFAWRSLLAGELILTGTKAFGLGHSLDRAGTQFDTPTVLALMAVIVVIGLLIDAAFAVLDRRVRARRGLLAAG